jgi:hypothetical protein
MKQSAEAVKHVHIEGETFILNINKGITEDIKLFIL